MKQRQLFSIVLCWLLASVVCGQGEPLELYVSRWGNEANSGSSPETALRTITTALSAVRAVGGGTVWVLPGVYDASTETFPLDPAPNTTVAGYDPENKPRIGGTTQAPVFWIHDIAADIPPWPESGDPPWPEPDAHAPVLKGLRIEDGGLCRGGMGGGVSIVRGSAHLIDCDIVGNHSGIRGGGVYAGDGSKVIAERCRILRNYGCSVFVIGGAGASVEVGSLGAFSDCDISQNEERSGTAGIYVRYFCQLFLRDCEFLGNFGEALDISQTEVLIERCTISGHPNLAATAASSLDVYGGRLILRDSLICANTGGLSSGILLANTPAIIDRCVVAYNDSGGPLCEGAQGLYAYSSPPELMHRVTISNSIFWANNWFGESVEPLFPCFERFPGIFLGAGEIRYTIAERMLPQEAYYNPNGPVRYDHVLEADPLLVNPLQGDFRLLPGSPAIDAGDPDAPLDPDGSRADIGLRLLKPPFHPVFMRGDTNGDLVVDISDAVRILVGLFVDAERLTCWDAADVDDDGVVAITDPVSVLTFIFRDPYHAPKPPYPGLGVDWIDDDIHGCTW